MDKSPDITEAPSLSSASVQRRLEAMKIRQTVKKKPDTPITTPSVAATITPSPTEASEEIIKKKRGRPRKNPTVSTPIAAPVAAPAAPVIEDHEQIQKPKTRGRHLKINLIRLTDQPKEDVKEELLTTENSGLTEVETVVATSVTKEEPIEEAESSVDADKSSDFSGMANVSSIFNVKIEPTFGPGYIPGLDLINDSMEVESSTNVRDNDFNITKKTSLSSKEKKAVENNSENEDKPKDEDDSDNKIRRSSRIKTLEEQRGSRGRRREVVFSTNDGPGLNKSTLNTNDDDSNSNGSNSLHGSFSTLSSPLREANSLSATSSSHSSLPSVNNFSAVSGLFSSSSGSLKPLKVKSRWRYSLDAENLKSSDSSNGNSADLQMLSLGNGSLESTSASLGSHHIQNSFEMSLKDRNLVRKSGYIVYEATDSELEDKLKKFEGIDENLFRTDKKISKEGRGMVCDCFLSKEDIMRGEIGCNEDCLNRLLMVECGSRCPTGDRCTNKKFQRKEYCPLEVFQTDKKGHGLRTLQPLPQGGFVIEYVGEVLDAREFKHRTKEYAKGKQEHFYFMALKSDAIIDATLRGNCSRFINHSCEPNCETQKWTVNGELRIGFFSIRDLQAGEEITFDYQFQRYGKKAQRCYCMTASCRGWIGGDEEGEKETVEPSEVQADVEQEQDQEKVKEKPKAERKKRKEVQLEDMAFEEELGKLELSGLKNRHHTLTLSRLMVRAEDWDIKERLLKILVNGDTPCRRLFLDYHGLRLIWSWMVDLPLPAQGSELQLIRNDQYHMLFLKALASLPIPNKSLLQDSKVLTLMEKWANSPPSSIISSAPKPDSSEAAPKDGKTLSIKAEDSSPSESKSGDSATKGQDVKVSPESTSADETSGKTGDIVEAAKAAQEELNWEFVTVAKSLLDCWADLKEVFRIPKKERVEQMKEHEREADKGSGHNEGSVSSGYERDSRKHSRSKERRVHVIDSSQHMPTYHRSSIRDRALSHPNLSKEERRLIFAAKVARQEMENKRRREQDDMVNLHQERCAALGLDASTTPIVDPSGTYYLDPNTISWVEIKVDDPNLPPELIPLVQATLYPPPLFEILTPEPEFVFPPWPDGLPPPPPLPPATLPPRWKMAVDDEGRCYYYDIKTRHTQWYPPSPESSEGYGSLSSGSSDSEDAEVEEVVDESATVVAQIHFQTKRSKLNERAEKRKKAGLVQERVISPRLDDERPAVSQKSIRARKQQLLEEKLKKLQEAEGIALVRAADGDLAVDGGSPERVAAIKEKHSRSHGVPTKRRRKESSRHSQQSKSKSSSKLRTKSHVSESQNLELSQMLVPESEFETPETANKPDNQDSGNPTVDSIIDIPTDTPAVDVIPGFMTDEERAAMAADSPRPTVVAKKSDRPKISEKDRKKHHSGHKKERDKDGSGSEKRSKEASKESFRNQIANVIVTHLNPYRKPDCKHGRIASTDDFKHLARKMTHAILLKELKHTRDAKSLEVNDSVRHKTKEYVKKFMARFPNSNYARSPEDTQGK